jgi:hypothetical protein
MTTSTQPTEAVAQNGGNEISRFFGQALGSGFSLVPVSKDMTNAMAKQSNFSAILSA